MRRVAGLITIVFLVFSCENKALHDSEEFKPREIHENIMFHFDPIVVDGIEYLILEKDNNNPHEGFGFMAFRANKLMEKQDSIIAYVRTVNEMQARIYARVAGISLEKSREMTDQLFEDYLSLELAEIEELERSDLSGMTNNESDSLRRDN